MLSHLACWRCRCHWLLMLQSRRVQRGCSGQLSQARQQQVTLPLPPQQHSGFHRQRLAGQQQRVRRWQGLLLTPSQASLCLPRWNLLVVVAVMLLLLLLLALHCAQQQVQREASLLLLPMLPMLLRLLVLLLHLSASHLAEPVGGRAAAAPRGVGARETEGRMHLCP